MSFFSLGGITGSLEIDTRGWDNAHNRIVNRQIRQIRRQFEGLTATINQVSTQMILAGGAMSASFGAISRSVLVASDTAEKLRIQMVGALRGSEKDANKLYVSLERLASQVPKSFEEVLEAGTTLATVFGDLGTDAVANFTRLAVDISSQFGLRMDMVVANLVRMYSGGIGAADLFRDKSVTAFLGFSSDVNYTLDETQKRLIELSKGINSRVAGAADKLASTLTGQLSMIGDFVFRLKRLLAEQGGIADYVKSILKEVIRVLGEIEKPLTKFISLNKDAIVEITKMVALISATGVALVGLGLILRSVGFLMSLALGGVQLIINPLTILLGLLYLLSASLRVYSQELKDYFSVIRENVNVLKDNFLEFYNRTLQPFLHNLGTLAGAVWKLLKPLINVIWNVTDQIKAIAREVAAVLLNVVSVMVAAFASGLGELYATLTDDTLSFREKMKYLASGDIKETFAPIADEAAKLEKSVESLTAAMKKAGNVDYTRDRIGESVDFMSDKFNVFKGVAVGSFKSFKDFVVTDAMPKIRNQFEQDIDAIGEYARQKFPKLARLFDAVKLSINGQTTLGEMTGGALSEMFHGTFDGLFDNLLNEKVPTIVERLGEVGTALQRLQSDWSKTMTTAANNVVDLANVVKGELAGSFVDVITGTKTAEESFKEFGKTVVKTILEMIAKMILQWAIAKALQLAGFGQTAATAAATTAAWAPAAAAASIATLGGALIFGPAAIAAIGATQGISSAISAGVAGAGTGVSLSGGFRSGGEVHKDGIYMLHRGEEVMTPFEANNGKSQDINIAIAFTAGAKQAFARDPAFKDTIFIEFGEDAMRKGVVEKTIKRVVADNG